MDNWFNFAVAGYLLLAIEAVGTKILLTNKIKSWQLYSFYVGLLSLNGVFFAFFGLQWFGWVLFLESILAGIVFFASLVFLYKSLEKSSASRVFVLFGAATTLASFVLGLVLLGEKFSLANVIGILLLTVGGLFISFKFHEKRLFSNYKNVILAGCLMGLASVILKDVFDKQNFITGYVFSRTGIFLSAMGLLLIPNFRKTIKKSLKSNKKSKNGKNFGWVLFLKTLAGAGSFLVNYSIALGSVVLVNALVSIQYMFTFLLATLVSVFFKKAIQEKLTWQNLAFKMIGLVLIVYGVLLVK